jgi:hypothetical protein
LDETPTHQAAPTPRGTLTSQQAARRCRDRRRQTQPTRPSRCALACAFFRRTRTLGLANIHLRLGCLGWPLTLGNLGPIFAATAGVHTRGTLSALDIPHHICRICAGQTLKAKRTKLRLRGALPFGNTEARHVARGYTLHLTIALNAHDRRTLLRACAARTARSRLSVFIPAKRIAQRIAQSAKEISQRHISPHVVNGS